MHSGPPHISFCVDDFEKTVAEPTARGFEFSASVSNRGYGLITGLKVPGDRAVHPYHPRYENCFDGPVRPADSTYNAQVR